MTRISPEHAHISWKIVCFISPLIGDFDLVRPPAIAVLGRHVCFISPLIGDFDFRTSSDTRFAEVGLKFVLFPR